MKKASRKAQRSAQPRHALFLLALMCAALLAYSNSFQTGFPFDNTLVIRDFRVQSATSENLGLIFSREYWYNFQNSGLYRPLTTLSYLINYVILGSADHAAGYHWINFAIHAANIALVYALAFLILQDVLPAVALAAIWSLHPVLTESVTNIVGRADLLSAFGVLAALLCHIKAARSAGRRRQGWFVALLLAAAIGMFSKESAIVLLPLMLLYDLTFAPARWRARIPGYLAAVSPTLAFLAVRSVVLNREPSPQFLFVDNPIAAADFLTGRFTAINVIGEYLHRLLWPLHLSSDYSYNQIPLVAWRWNSWDDWKAVLALGICIAAVVTAIFCYRRRKPISFLIAFFFVALAPTANIAFPIGTIMAERFLYLPSIGFAGCLVLAFYAAVRRAPRVAPVALAVVALAFAARTFARNFDWQDDATLAAAAVQTSPGSFKTHMLYAAQLLVSDSVDAAIAEIEKSVAIVDRLPDNRNAGLVYIAAATYYRQKGEKLAPRKPDRTLGSTAETNYWYRKALDALARAQRIPHAAGSEIYQLDLERGRTCMRLNDPIEAAHSFDGALDYGIGLDLYQERSAAWRAAGDSRRAVLSYLEARVLDPNLPVPNGETEQQLQADTCTAYRNVAQVYRKIGREHWVADTNRIAQEKGCR